MFNMFQSFNGFSMFGSSISTYNPLINYDWSTTTASGLRYLKDVGSTPTYNASMYFGRGAYFNGVDQGVTFNTFSPLSENTILFNISNIGVASDLPLMVSNSHANYRIMYSYTSGDYWSLSLDLRQFGGNILTTGYILPKNTNCQICIKEIAGVISIYANNEVVKVFNATLNGGIFNQLAFSSLRSQYSKFTIKDLFIFNRTLTQSEITQAYEQPELFYAMAQADSTCVLNMPMCETDGYVRNMKSYSEGNELLKQDTTLWIFSGGWSTDGVSLICNSSTYGIATISSRFIYTINDIYYFKIEIFNYVSGTLQLQIGSSWVDLPKANGLYLSIFKATGTEFNLRSKGGFIGSVSTKSIKKLSGVHEITNYTTSVRDNAKNLQYGLQTCKFVRDSLGVIQGSSNYLECDGVGYGNTGWIPSATEDWSIETVLELPAVPPGAYNKYIGIGADIFIEQRNTLANSLKIKVWTTEITVTNLVGLLHSIILTSNGVIYLDATSVKNALPTKTLLTQSLYLGARNMSGVSAEYVNKPIRLFKVHNKVLTQAEITANYNSYVAKGLLS